MLGVLGKGDEAGQRCDQSTRTADVHTHQQISIVAGELGQQNGGGNIADELAGQNGEQKGTFLHEEGEPTQAYKNVPLVHSSLGHSIFFNTYYPIRFDVGQQRSDKFGVEIYGYQFDIYVWTDTIQKNIHSYMELTGKPFLPPKWAFDYWMGGAWNVWNKPNDTYALANIEDTLDKYEEMGIKIGPAYFEMNADPEIFEMLRRRGVTPLMWTNSCLLPKWGGTLDYNNYLVKKASNPEENMEFDYIDFTAPKSRNAVWDKE